MIATRLRQPTRVTLAIVVIVALSPVAAQAADASSWDADSRAGVRLIAGNPAQAADAPLRAGVELTLAPGWKTYWRYPGDSGVPPRFDFSNSQNVKSLNIAWPAPHRFTDDSGATIGYKNGVIFPLRIVPQDPAKPVLLRLKLDYAVCEKLCVPAEGRAELVLDGTPSTFDAALAKADALDPSPPSPATTLRSRYAPCDRNRAATAHVSSWMSRRRETSLSSCSPKDRRPNGPCRCPNRSTAQAPDCTGSPFSSTACRPAPAPRGRP